MGRIRKKYELRNKKNTVVLKLGLTNITKRTVADGVLKNHKPFFINIGNYRDISLQIRQLFAHLRPVKYWSRDRAPPNTVCMRHS